MSQVEEVDILNNIKVTVQLFWDFELEEEERSKKFAECKQTINSRVTCSLKKEAWRGKIFYGKVIK